MFERHRRDLVSSRLRLRGHDYASPATHFVTLCTQLRVCLFGSIDDGVMDFSPAGTVIESWWYSTPRRFPQVIVDEMVVMPNHLYGILVVNAMPDPEVGTTLPSLSAILQWFKGVSTNDYIRGVWTNGWQEFDRRLWQKGFYEHIVRSEPELDRIRAYICDNPALWSDDEDNPERSIG